MVGGGTQTLNKETEEMGGEVKVFWYRHTHGTIRTCSGQVKLPL